MLTGSNDRSLTYKNVDTKLMFFYQRWQELLDHRTLDMYRYNILNTCVACVELLDVINKTLSGLLTSRQNVDDAKAETLVILKQDDVLQKYDRPLYVSLMRIISSKLESKNKQEATEDKSSSFYISLNRLKYQLTTPVKLLESRYQTYLLSEIKVDIDNEANAQLDRHMSLLVSQCISRGWSARGLFLLSKCFEGSSSLDEKWREFSSKVSLQTPNSFEVYFQINIETRQGITVDVVRNIIQSLDMEIKKGTKSSKRTLLVRNYFQKLILQNIILLCT
jgi:hypothetical protein